MIAGAKLAGALVICCALQACSTLRNGGAPDPSFDINADLEQLATEFKIGTNIADFYGVSPDKRIDARNRFISGRLVQIDLRYLQFIRALTSDKQQLDSATDIANLTLNLAGTLVGGVRAKINLAASAAGISGAKTTIDKDYYYEKSINALVATMNAKRKEVLVDILTGLATRSLEQYPFERALTDVNLYYLAGTLNGAIQFIHTEAAQKEQKSDAEIKDIPILAIPTVKQITDADRLTDSIGGDLKIDKANLVLGALGVDDAKHSKTLDGPDGARQQLKNKVRSAMRLRNDDARNAEIKKITDAFQSAGILK
jgi:hypothetical protein